jgi:hypothetical protein
VELHYLKYLTEGSDKYSVLNNLMTLCNIDVDFIEVTSTFVSYFTY